MHSKAFPPWQAGLPALHRSHSTPKTAAKTAKKWLPPNLCSGSGMGVYVNAHESNVFAVCRLVQQLGDDAKARATGCCRHGAQPAALFTLFSGRSPGLHLWSISARACLATPMHSGGVLTLVVHVSALQGSSLPSAIAPSILPDALSAENANLTLQLRPHTDDHLHVSFTSLNA